MKLLTYYGFLKSIAPSATMMYCVPLRKQMCRMAVVMLVRIALYMSSNRLRPTPAPHVISRC